jgi:hypothetical protein
MGLETAVMPLSTPLLDSIDALCAELDTMEQGGIITISLDSTSLSTLSAQTLAALKAKQGTLVINFSGYSCSIDGVEMGTLPIEPVNIEMKMTKKEAVTETADGQDVYQLHFTQIGDLPGCFTYSFEALKSRPDDALYLYCYHDTSGLAEYKRSTFVDKNNCAAFEIYEGGSYFVTTSPITENPVTGQFSKPEDTTPLGDIWSIVVPVVCIICAGAAFIVVLCRKGFFKIGR